MAGEGETDENKKRTVEKVAKRCNSKAGDRRDNKCESGITGFKLKKTLVVGGSGIFSVEVGELCRQKNGR